MSKAKMPPGMGKGMMEQLQRMQQELNQAQEELSGETIEASAGGGAVKITMSGTQECLAVEIEEQLLEQGDREMIQDLVMLAINQAITDSQLLAARRLGPLAGSSGIPGLNP